jgi:hypothetical protein
METFLPVQFDGIPRPSCVQLAAEPVLTGRLSRSALKRLEALETKATFHAGLVATGCRTAYELERTFGPNIPRDGEAVWIWNANRDHVWDRWQRGTSTVAHMRRNNKAALLQRLEAVRAISPLLDETLAMPLWRCLDPRPLTTVELEPPNQQVHRFMGDRAFGPLALRSSLASLTKHQVAGLAAPETRYDAMNGLWLRLRSSCSIDTLGHYALHYLCWLHARPSIEADPIFGPFADELYEYTQPCSYPQVSAASRIPSTMSVRRVSPRHMTVIPGGGSFLRAR